ncbi:dihydrolipoyl dehydrogenase [Leptospira sp. GIMC2001]|uniref:dihydrolipoyl dehydrogenase n=1 Tax=Leptospira sp. GIMC2001 TaxID=1513297 RepID=UPI0023498908|nr:dihydrolipoyl dehydrogenase [Leptospira sp. GIMC2001]WCL50216.1 dihydrolipoyl dehydrogenase [Leptospira sp. GIMC2001]
MSEETQEFQVIVVGGGPGGYVAAIRASQLGFKVAVVEREKMGGICLNWGCIPTKALLESAHLLEDIKSSKQFGIQADKISVEFPEVIKHSRNVADQMASGVDFLMKKNKITVINGNAKIIDKTTIEVSDKDKKVISKLKTNYIILALGARPRPLPFLPFDEKFVLSSREAMVLKEVPKKLAIIGAGAIGIEFADIYASMGSEVTVIEALPNLLPNEDEEISKVLERSFKKRKIDFYTSTKVLSAEVSDKKKSNNISLTLEGSDSKKETIECDRVIVGIGVIPNTEQIGLEEVGIKVSRGFIDIDKFYRSTVDNIYAIGDCIATPLLAHVASSEGIRASEDISIREGNPHHLKPDFLNYSAIPGNTYCHPEVASVGLTEKKAKENGLEFNIGKFPYTANGRARAMNDAEGFIKLIADKNTDAILGAHIIGSAATEMINEIVLAINSELTITGIARSIHAHPTISEVIMEAAEAVHGKAIHI